jgi:lipoprotein-releasing system permease protein
MFSKVEWMIAFRYLKAKKRTGFISVIAGFSLLGVSLGVAALIIVMSVMNGFHKELTSKMVGFNGGIMVYGIGDGINKFDEVAKKIKTISGVSQAIPLVEGQVMATNKKWAGGAVVKGIKKDDLKKKTLISDNIVSGSLDQFNEYNIILGSELAADLNLHVGDEVTLISPQGMATVMGMMPRLKVYNVVGIFTSGMYQYDKTTIFMPFSAAQVYFRHYNQASSIEIDLENPSSSLIVTDKIYGIFKSKYRVVDWQMSNMHFLNALKTERSVMFIILTLIILIAAFNIISSLIMLVKDKTKDIAILRTIGATKGMILRIFILCGAAIGLIGTLSGFILGISFALNIEKIRRVLESFTGNTLFDPVIYYLSELPVDVHASDIVKVVVMAISLSFIATILPAYQAAKLDPVKGLRNE